MFRFCCLPWQYLSVCSPARQRGNLDEAIPNPYSRWRHIRRLFGIERRRLWCKYISPPIWVPVIRWLRRECEWIRNLHTQTSKQPTMSVLNLGYQNGLCTSICPEGILLNSWASTMIVSSRWKPSAWDMGQRSTLAIAVGGDFHLVLEVLPNLHLHVEHKVMIDLSMTFFIYLE